MQLDKFLIITKVGKGYYGSSLKLEVKERTPSLAGNQIAVRLRLEIPDELFTRPILEAKMAIPKEAVPMVTITPEITTDIERIIKQSTGLTMNVGIVEHEKNLPFESSDSLDRTGDFSNLQKFKKGQKVRFWPSVKDPKFAGIHLITDIEAVEVGHVIKTDRHNEWIHVHWFAPVKK